MSFSIALQALVINKPDIYYINIQRERPYLSIAHEGLSLYGVEYPKSHFLFIEPDYSIYINSKSLGKLHPIEIAEAFDTVEDYLKDGGLRIINHNNICRFIIQNGSINEF